MSTTPPSSPFSFISSSASSSPPVTPPANAILLDFSKYRTSENKVPSLASLAKQIYRSLASTPPAQHNALKRVQAFHSLSEIEGSPIKRIASKNFPG